MTHKDDSFNLYSAHAVTCSCDKAHIFPSHVAVPVRHILVQTKPLLFVLWNLFLDIVEISRWITFKNISALFSKFKL